MKKYYSRLSKLEERRNVRSAVIYGGLTIVAIVVILIFGIQLIARVTGTVGDIKNSNAPVQKNDTTAPPPPNFINPPDFTNNDKVTLTGNTEAGATVSIFMNGNKSEVVSGADGSFSRDFELSAGNNTFWATATDNSGNKSNETNHFVIVLDKTAPKLTINSPSDNANFYGDSQKQQAIQGTSEANVSITINDRIVAVNDDGNFKSVFTLQSGENNFDIKATDQAGNLTEQKIKVNFTSY